MADLVVQLKEFRLTTAQIFYHLPDYPKFLQEFVWQDYDRAPDYPKLLGFLNFWEDTIEGKLHSVYVARTPLITPSDARFAEFEGTLQ